MSKNQNIHRITELDLFEMFIPFLYCSVDPDPWVFCSSDCQDSDCNGRFSVDLLEYCRIREEEEDLLQMPKPRK